MATLAEIREGLAANLAALGEGIQVSAYMLNDPYYPSVHVIPGPVQYDQAMHRGLDVWTFIVQAFVVVTDDIGSQQLLDVFLAPTGSQSVKTVIEADKTLGGKAQTLHVTDCTGYQQFVRGSDPLLMAEWKVDVYL